MKIKIVKTLKGRAVSLSDEGVIYLGQNYKVLKYDASDELSLVGRVPCKMGRKFIEPFRLLCRLLRHEIRGFKLLADGSKVVAARYGLYHSEPGEILLKPALLPKTKLAIKFPRAITVDSTERVLWGECWGNPERRNVRIFISQDKGKSYELAFEFKSGDVKHVHNILEDPYEKCYWVFVGDHGAEPGIGRLTNDLKHLDWLVRGEQRHRATGGFIFEDRIVYGTDTEKDFNAIYAVDKTSGKLEKLCQTPGSCIYSAKFGKWYALSTSVEYFEKYENKWATLWVSMDALNWRQVYKAEKDIWSKKYFQFGSLVLPIRGWDREQIVFSGLALKGIDGKICIAEIVE